MQSSSVPSLVAVLAMITPGFGLAQPPAVQWRCDRDRCVGHVQMAAAEDLLAQCRRTVRTTGPVSAFRIGGRALSAAELRACNRFVIATQPPRD